MKALSEGTEALLFLMSSCSITVCSSWYKQQSMSAYVWSRLSVEARGGLLLDHLLYLVQQQSMLQARCPISRVMSATIYYQSPFWSSTAQKTLASYTGITNAHLWGRNGPRMELWALIWIMVNMVGSEKETEGAFPAMKGICPPLA
eukprot:1160552-Pelagomonas_calceolata.AAC.18